MRLTFLGYRLVITAAKWNQSLKLALRYWTIVFVVILQPLWVFILQLSFDAIGWSLIFSLWISPLSLVSWQAYLLSTGVLLFETGQCCFDSCPLIHYRLWTDKARACHTYTLRRQHLFREVYRDRDALSLSLAPNIAEQCFPSSQYNTKLPVYQP